jgi:hypothetical protein
MTTDAKVQRRLLTRAWGFISVGISRWVIRYSNAMSHNVRFSPDSDQIADALTRCIRRAPAIP